MNRYKMSTIIIDRLTGSTYQRVIEMDECVSLRVPFEIMVLGQLLRMGEELVREMNADEKP